MRSLRGRKTVFVGMSGGVDSSVAAMILKENGYDVVGVFLRSYNVDGCAERDAEDARRVAEHIGIPFYAWDCEEEYKKKVVSYMVEEYRAGRTPNPDVMCNREIKFGIFLKRAKMAGADYVATGHYVRLERENLTPSTRFAHPATHSLVLAGSPPEKKGKRADRAEPATRVSESQTFSLFAAKDKSKDQSYFLWTLTQNQLKHCLFPIGEYEKSEVRNMARRAGLPTADKKDSQGICFLGEVSLADFLKEYIPEHRGTVLTASGKAVGEHSGVSFYTVGQRHGLGISGKTPYYISEKNAETNTLVVAEGGESDSLYRREVSLESVNLIRPIEKATLSVMARVRYRQPLSKATLRIEVDKANLSFEKPQKFVAPGQSAVFYVEESNPSRSSGRRSCELRMLGGGVIS